VKRDNIGGVVTHTSRRCLTFGQYPFARVREIRPLLGLRDAFGSLSLRSRKDRIRKASRSRGEQMQYSLSKAPGARSLAPRLSQRQGNEEANTNFRFQHLGYVERPTLGPSAGDGMRYRHKGEQKRIQQRRNTTEDAGYYVRKERISCTRPPFFTDFRGRWAACDKANCTAKLEV
jgi:hypothetical protein